MPRRVRKVVIKVVDQQGNVLIEKPPVLVDNLVPVKEAIKKALGDSAKIELMDLKDKESGKFLGRFNSLEEINVSDTTLKNIQVYEVLADGKLSLNYTIDENGKEKFKNIDTLRIDRDVTLVLKDDTGLTDDLNITKRSFCISCGMGGNNKDVLIDDTLVGISQTDKYLGEEGFLRIKNGKVVSESINNERKNDFDFYVPIVLFNPVVSTTDFATKDFAGPNLQIQTFQNPNYMNWTDLIHYNNDSYDATDVVSLEYIQKNDSNQAFDAGSLVKPVQTNSRVTGEITGETSTSSTTKSFDASQIEESMITRLLMNPTERKIWGKMYGLVDDDDARTVRKSEHYSQSDNLKQTDDFKHSNKKTRTPNSYKGIDDSTYDDKSDKKGPKKEPKKGFTMVDNEKEAVKAAEKNQSNDRGEKPSRLMFNNIIANSEKKSAQELEEGPETMQKTEEQAETSEEIDKDKPDDRTNKKIIVGNMRNKKKAKNKNSESEHEQNSVASNKKRNRNHALQPLVLPTQSKLKELKLENKKKNKRDKFEEKKQDPLKFNTKKTPLSAKIKVVVPKENAEKAREKTSMKEREAAIFMGSSPFNTSEFEPAIDRITKNKTTDKSKNDNLKAEKIKKTKLNNTYKLSWLMEDKKTGKSFKNARQ